MLARPQQAMIDHLKRINAQKTGKGEQKTATADLKAKQKEAQDAYQAAAQVARAALAPPDLATLGLVGKTPCDTAGFIAAGYTLFDNAASSGLLAGFGYDADRLIAERAKIEVFDAANQAQEAAKGLAQQATQDQEVALAAMNDWTAQYLKCDWTMAISLNCRIGGCDETERFGLQSS